MTMIAISRTESLRTLANIYVISLAIADLVVGLGFSMLGIFMLPPYKDKYFDNNINICVFMQGILIGTIITSGFHMTLISFDRYIYITRPYSYQRIFTKRNIILFLTAIWTFGVFMIIMPQFDYNDVSRIGDCDLVLSLPLWYLFYTTSLTFGLNIVIAIFMYSQILVVALRQRKAIQATTVTALATGHKDTGQTKEEAAKRTKKAFKSIKFFFTVFGFYFVCMTPCFITVTLELYATLSDTIFRISTLIAMLNSGMNFLIYAVLNKQFKQAFADILKCRPSSQ